MFGSVVLDVAAGLVFIYLVLSLVCSALRESIEARLKTRAVHLQQGITEMLRHGDVDTLASRLYQHPLVFSLYKGDYVAPKQTDFTGMRWVLPTIVSWFRTSPSAALPSYIPTRNFAIALLDLAAAGDAAHEGAGQPMTIERIRAGVKALGNPSVERVIGTALDTARGDVDMAILNVQNWFDSAMDRVSGWYKRESQHILFWLGLLLVVVLNVDTIAIVRHLATSETARAALVQVAQEEVARGVPPGRAPTVDAPATAASIQSSDDKVRALSDRLLSLNVPIGWDTARPGGSVAQWATSIAGWLLTAFAVSFGAPFWFDLLNKIMVIRSTVKPHEKSPEESSEDRQSPTDTLLRTLLKERQAAAPAHPTAAAADDGPPTQGGSAPGTTPSSPT